MTLLGVSGGSKLGAGLRLCAFLGASGICWKFQRTKKGRKNVRNIRKFVAGRAGRWLALVRLGGVVNAHE